MVSSSSSRCTRPRRCSRSTSPSSLWAATRSPSSSPLRPAQAEAEIAVAIARHGAGQRAEQRQHRPELAAHHQQHQRRHEQQAQAADQDRAVLEEMGERQGCQHRQQDQCGGERGEAGRQRKFPVQAAHAQERLMPSRSMRRYSACRLRPSSAAACESTPPALARARSMLSRSGSGSLAGVAAGDGAQSEVGDADHRASGEQAGALHRVLQFAHVARPGVPEQCRTRRRR